MKYIYFLGAVFMLCCTACTGFFDLGEEKIQAPDKPNQTFVRFVNQSHVPVKVYSSFDRRSGTMVVHLQQDAQQDKAWFPSSEGYSFYLEYYLVVDSVEIPYIPKNGKDVVEIKIRRDITTSLEIKSLQSHDIEISDAYLAIKNAGTSGFRLVKGTSTIYTESGEDLINQSEIGVYKIDPQTSGYAILVGATQYPISESFEGGHLYSLSFNGSTVSKVNTTEISTVSY